MALWLSVIFCSGAAAQAWVAQGPGPNTEGQVEGIRDREVAGAIHVVAPHPTDPNIVYVGAVNGGIWRTDNATAAAPDWRPLSGTARSLSIAALGFDPTDRSAATLVAGIGQISSYFGLGGGLIGLMRSTDGGASWTQLDGGGTLRGEDISGIAARGAVIVAASKRRGIFRSTDMGRSWTLLSGQIGSGLPAGPAFALGSDPRDPARLFANAGDVGLYRSTDTGASWRKVSDAAIDQVLGGVSNLRISVGAEGSVYIAIAANGELAGLFRSADGGVSWTPLELPRTVEGAGQAFGIHPGEQASIHMSLVADPANPFLVYLGGDRQPSFDEGGAGGRQWPNSLGARDYTGRLFRVDASRPSGQQATPLTHNGTRSGSAPHADSRNMAFSANGSLLEVNDGGIYRRTRPQTADGDWASMNGNIHVTEFHSAAWDANARIVIGGAQDTGTPEQSANSAGRWRSVTTADGGVVAVDDTGTPGRSVRYTSWQYLGGLSRRVYDASNRLLSTVPLRLTVLGGGVPPQPQFYTPIRLNAVQPRRLVIGAQNGVYESADQGDSVRAIAPGIMVNSTGPIAYGARGNPDILYVGSRRQVLIRSAAHPADLRVAQSYPGQRQVLAIAVHPDEPSTAFVADQTDVYRTTDMGTTWHTIAGNLGQLDPGPAWSIAFGERFGGGSVIIGAENGVYAAVGPDFSVWLPLGTGLPAVPVLQLEYDRTDHILLAATLGRGAWTLTPSAPARR